jgi:hypothetical protein
MTSCEVRSYCTVWCRCTGFVIRCASILAVSYLCSAPSASFTSSSNFSFRPDEGKPPKHTRRLITCSWCRISGRQERNKSLLRIHCTAWRQGPLSDCMAYVNSIEMLEAPSLSACQSGVTRLVEMDDEMIVWTEETPTNQGRGEEMTIAASTEPIIAFPSPRCGQKLRAFVSGCNTTKAAGGHGKSMRISQFGGSDSVPIDR